MTSVVCVAELVGNPVATKIVDTARKKEDIIEFHNSPQYVAVGLYKKSGSLAMTEGQLIHRSRKNFCLQILQKVNPFYKDFCSSL
jgi:hypothetical protein